MYVFATVALLGLAVAVFVELVGGFVTVSGRIRPLLAFLAGIAAALVVDYSMFVGWGIDVRAGWVGPVGTGLVIGGLASAWHELFRFAASSGRRDRDEATDAGTRAPRAA